MATNPAEEPLGSPRELRMRCHELRHALSWLTVVLEFPKSGIASDRDLVEAFDNAKTILASHSDFV